jgi:ribosomal protein L31E
MSNYKKIVEDALKKSKFKKTLNEGVVYPEGITERMDSKLEEDLFKRTHSLGKHPIFPDDDESTFEEKIMGERFTEVVNRYKRYFDTDLINNKHVMGEMMPMVYETMGIEAKHKKKLEELAIKMVREEFNMGEDVVEIHAELTNKINMEGTKKNPKPMAMEVEFKNHDEVTSANEEVYKRRFINAMIQGAAKKCNHMFNMVDDKLIDLDPRLPNKYAKIMSAADYMYYIIPNMENGISGGVVRVQFPTPSNPKAIIHVQAMVFPVLIHEIVKGVMELVSGHGLPKKKRIGEYVINKADFLSAEPWDMRLGPAIWGRFTKMINPDDFNLKHHIYMEMVSLPVKEFNVKMREVMGGTKEGKKIIEEIVKNVKADLQEEEFNEAMTEISLYREMNTFDSSDQQVFNFEELIKGDSKDDDSDDDLDGYDFEDLFNG